jgi:hypothetical protein
MTSSLVIMTHWILNENKWFTFYDSKKIKEFTTNQTKEFKYLDSDKTYKMFEHKIPLSGNLVKANGFDGYQYRYYEPKTKSTFIIAIPFGRRMKEGKQFVQELNDVLVMMGLKEPEVVSIDISGVDVSGVDISGVDVSGVDVSGVDVSNN